VSWAEGAIPNNNGSFDLISRFAGMGLLSLSCSTNQLVTTSYYPI
jgi:hypothetical protein